MEGVTQYGTEIATTLGVVMASLSGYFGWSSQDKHAAARKRLKWLVKYYQDIGIETDLRTMSFGQAIDHINEHDIKWRATDE